MADEIVIVDYGMANLRSVQKAFEKVGFSATISGEPDRVGSAVKVVLPGVGAFRDAIARIRETRLDEPLLHHLRQGKPFFGICLGLQMLFTNSHEDGLWPGLDFFAGDIVRFESIPGRKVPHMGWNQLQVMQPAAPCLHGFPENGSVYFVHSYHAVPRDRSLVAATTDYEETFVSAICRDRIFATQFHPEKSQALGLEMLRRFGRLSN